MPQVSFSTDIKPLFGAIDISHMKPFGVELDNYSYMSNPTTLIVCSQHSQHTMANRLACRLADPTGQKPSSRCLLNGRKTDINREPFWIF